MRSLLALGSISVFERMTIDPRPVSKALRTPARPMIIPPVGKSGAGTISMTSSSVNAGLLI